MKHLLLLGLSVLGSSVGVAHAQSAEGTPPQDTKVEGDNLEEVTVAGTRVARAGFDAPNDLPPPFTGLGQNYDPIGRSYRLGMKVEL